jgi:predicted nucleic acid-binding protein
VIYFDSSALVKLVWAEEHSIDLVGWLNQYPDEHYVSSTLGDIELRRTVWRVDPGAMEDADSVLAELTLLPIDATVVRVAGQLSHSYLRALDAIHLATATGAFRPGDIQHFITYDKRLRQVAVSEGLPAVAPGYEEGVTTYTDR